VRPHAVGREKKEDSMKSVCERILEFQPVDGNWRPLDELLAELPANELSEETISVLISVFEKYPTDDGEGVLWSIIHYLEAFGGYEHQLLKSVATAPSEMAVIMVNRMINAGITKIGDVDLLGTLYAVSQNTRTPEAVRTRANSLVEYQKKKQH
jgi:hypothetical protein